MCVLPIKQSHPGLDSFTARKLSSSSPTIVLPSIVLNISGFRCVRQKKKTQKSSKICDGSHSRLVTVNSKARGTGVSAYQCLLCLCHLELLFQRFQEQQELHGIEGDITEASRQSQPSPKTAADPPSPRSALWRCGPCRQVAARVFLAIYHAGTTPGLDQQILAQIRS